MKLADRVAIITGAASGFGKATAILFAKEGAKIVVADLNDAGGEETVAAVKSSGGEAIFIHTDVSKSSDIKNLVETAYGKFGKIDIMFNNAGIPQNPLPVENIDESLWDRIFAINLKSIFLAAKYVFPIMKKAGGGVIINTASVGGVRPRKDSAAYGTTKGAVIVLTKELAVEGAPSHIRVNAINPVLADTPMLPGLLPDGVDLDIAKKAMIETIPLGRIATVEDVAYAALFLASDESSLVTGSAIYVDGGRGI
jgi:3-oxoacyl-[acyl-carrier protein] reductase